MKIAICDDDLTELNRITAFLDEYSKTKRILLTCKTFCSSIELASTAMQESYDLYLLDILMPALNGIELAREIRNFDRAADLIFLTSSPEYAVDSYTVKASDYLLKPVQKWLGTLVSFCFDDSPVAANLTMILVTVPLLLIVTHFFVPYIVKLKYENKTTLLLFFLLPLGYYVVEYTFTVYTDLLYTGGAVVVEFTDSFIVMLYFILSMLSIEFSNQKNQAERENLLWAYEHAGHPLLQRRFCQPDSVLLC